MKTRTYGIGLYAPAGFVIEPEAIARAIARLEAAGHRVIVDPTGCITAISNVAAMVGRR